MSDPRRMRLLGLHHVTAICADLDRTTAFYRDLLGLALVREGVNDDDPAARHFWFGDAEGSPGTLVSFLEYPGMRGRPVRPRRDPSLRARRRLRRGARRVARLPALPRRRRAPTSSTAAGFARCTCATLTATSSRWRSAGRRSGGRPTALPVRA